MAGSFPRLDPAGTRETFERVFTLTDDETGEAIDLDGVTAITFEIQNPGTRAVELSAEIGDGVTLGEDDDGAFFTVRFEADAMGSLCSKQYDLRMIIEADGDATEAVGTLQVVE